MEILDSRNDAHSNFPGITASLLLSHVSVTHERHTKENPMKKTLIPIALAFALGAVALSGTAMAIDTATVTVSANVVGTCKFSSPTGAVAFGALTPSTTPSDVTAVVTQPKFWCTKGAAYTIGDDLGLHSLP